MERVPAHLVNNAGVMDTPHETTKQGWGSCSSPPSTSATSRWPPRLHESLAATGDARIVAVSSRHLFFDRREYTPGLFGGCNEDEVVDQLTGIHGVMAHALDPHAATAE